MNARSGGGRSRAGVTADRGYASGDATLYASALSQGGAETCLGKLILLRSASRPARMQASGRQN
jgi:hypothetical protein